MATHPPLRCITCRKPIEGRPGNPFAPFCSSRCKDVDLGRWLNEDYRIPCTGEDDEDGEATGEGKGPGLSLASREN